jgi:hypothetical protein
VRQSRPNLDSNLSASFFIFSTCFWAGDFLASKIRVTRPVRDPRRSGETEVVGIQTYLQDAFFASFKQLVDAVGDLEGVIGYEVRAIYPSLQAKPCAEP